jgi:hypothetical protein
LAHIFGLFISLPGAEIRKSVTPALSMIEQKSQAKAAEDKKIFNPNLTLFTNAIRVMGIKT